MPVALVTNSFGRDCYDGFDLHALADVVVISSVSACASRRGASTPSPASAWSRTRQLVTVDGIETNLEGAARLGIAGVLHTSAERTVRELDDRSGIRAAA